MVGDTEDLSCPNASRDACQSAPTLAPRTVITLRWINFSRKEPCYGGGTIAPPARLDILLENQRAKHLHRSSQGNAGVVDAVQRSYIGIVVITDNILRLLIAAILAIAVSASAQVAALSHADIGKQATIEDRISENLEIDIRDCCDTERHEVVCSSPCFVFADLSKTVVALRYILLRPRPLDESATGISLDAQLRPPKPYLLQAMV